jgi:hypothetical protein
MMIEGSGSIAGSGSGSIHLTSGSGSGGPKTCGSGGSGSEFGSGSATLVSSLNKNKGRFAILKDNFNITKGRTKNVQNLLEIIICWRFLLNFSAIKFGFIYG